MFGKICQVIVAAFSILTITYSSVLAEQCGTSQEELKEFFYSSWIGVKAPEFGADAKDRLKGPQVRLADYKGKRLLLYSYYTGNFVYGPSKEEQFKIYQKLFKAIDIRDQIGSNNFEIIIMTQSPDLYFLPPADQIPEENKEFRRLKDIPVVMTISPKPYDFLHTPGAIVIDRNGIIQAIYPRPITEDEIRKAATEKDWAQPVKSAPTEVCWEEFQLSTPSMQAKHVWSKKISRVIGMTSINFNGEDSYKLLAVNKDDKMIVMSSDGNIENEIKVPVNIEGKSAAIHWAALEKDKMAFVILDDQCPSKVTVFDKKGKVIWEYPSSGKNKISAIAFTQVKDDKKMTLLISLVDSNNKKELHLVSDQGKKLWKIDESISTKGLVFINRRNNVPGLILRPNYGGGINLFDGSGKYFKMISSDINLIGIIAADVMKENDLNQMIAISPHRSFTFFSKTTRHDTIHALAVAMNFEGGIL